ncbi:sensor domain-containing protein [Glycomyces sp. TRM65418]|uniref:sensor histidine kinase n=1 Tax=Glycomyces sp. TRM65418 TaxID=2867006 RepID=UPI001CE6F6BC|nr:sensor histidine kinase [Glycomyces sp. TRM65418]MCC3763986.1 sensor domain-containing protein [Glycomyces sp. TRM65418]QZD53682.1 sensor domain-containing protein [Glycomyces sp. TRM65418]
MDISATPAIAWRHAPLTAVKALWSGPTWRSLMHLVTGAVIGSAGGVVVLALVIAGFAGLITIVIPIFAGGALLVVSGALTVAQRSRHTAFQGVEWPDGPFSQAVTFAPRALLEILRSPRTWRQFSYHVIVAFYGFFAAFIAVAAWTMGPAMIASPLVGIPDGLDARHWFLCGAGVLVLLAAPWITQGLSTLDALIARRLLGVTRAEQLELRVTDLAASRDSTVDAADAERRRIERDLHDGAQQRLTSLAMNLGIARATLTDLPESGTRAIEQAHEEAKQVLTDLRDLVRGLHPAVLEDRGLDAALSAVAARSPVPVRLRVDMNRRVARDVEAVAYFVVSEALTNTARHADAQNAAVDVELQADLLRVRIADNGRGGADPDGGTGLQGLADRVRSVDGRFELTSPLGGPTVIEVELPCAS